MMMHVLTNLKINIVLFMSLEILSKFNTLMDIVEV